jgi:hypothetical protein
MNKEDIDLLILSIETMYKLTKDWIGNLYFGIKLDGITSHALSTSQ